MKLAFATIGMLLWNCIASTTLDRLTTLDQTRIQYHHLKHHLSPQSLHASMSHNPYLTQLILRERDPIFISYLPRVLEQLESNPRDIHLIKEIFSSHDLIVWDTQPHPPNQISLSNIYPLYLHENEHAPTLLTRYLFAHPAHLLDAADRSKVQAFLEIMLLKTLDLKDTKTLAMLTQNHALGPLLTRGMIERIYDAFLELHDIHKLAALYASSFIYSRLELRNHIQNFIIFLIYKRDDLVDLLIKDLNLWTQISQQDFDRLVLKIASSPALPRIPFLLDTYPAFGLLMRPQSWERVLLGAVQQDHREMFDFAISQVLPRISDGSIDRLFERALAAPNVLPAFFKNAQLQPKISTPTLTSVFDRVALRRNVEILKLFKETRSALDRIPKGSVGRAWILVVGTFPNLHSNTVAIKLLDEMWKIKNRFKWFF